jgi:alpha-tubulin suppressor-like RCC1 family protein
MTVVKTRRYWIAAGIFLATLSACDQTTTVAPTGLSGRQPPAPTSLVRSAQPTPAAIGPDRTAALTLGGNFTCALTVAGGASCWGNNRYGQLGDGTYLSADLPQPVARATSGITAVAAGWSHACALRSTGELDCWGANAQGQLGDGTTVDSRAPVAVAGIGGKVTAVAAGYRHTCALLETGGVKCWGGDASGSLGDGGALSRNVPVDVSGLTAGVQAVDTGAGHTCALLESGAVKCWGWNNSGQVGDGTAVDRRTPVDVAGLGRAAVAVAAGDQHTCALLDDGSVACWGANASGQLGNGLRVRSGVPAAVVGLSGPAVRITAGGAHTCALIENGTVECWGDDQSGQLGDGGYENRSAPTPVVLPAAAGFIAAGFSHTCALLVDRRIECWGWNTEGQLGDGTVKSRRTPADVAGFSGQVAAVAAGWSHACMLSADAGGVRCWGWNGSGQLGDGSNSDRTAPVSVASLDSGWVAVAVGGEHACALSETGGVKCWGRNDRGQLGSGTNADRNRPVDVAGLPEETVAVAAGRAHTCALNVRGGVKCWGANEDGQLGDGTAVDRNKPAAVSGLAEGVVGIAAGGNHTCALTRAGGLKCWGSNKYGELGDGSLENRPEPVDVSGLAAGVDSFSLGGFHTCAIVGAVLQCWGWNAYGQLGDSTPTDRAVPVEVRWLAGTAAFVSAGSDFTCAILRAGNLRCWGNGEFGQLGDGGAAVHHTPVDVQGLRSRVLLLDAGFYSACAVTADGVLKCWGNNLYGQLGDGSTANRGVPVDVIGLE